MELLKAQQRAYNLQKKIKKLCIKHRVTLCNYDGGIGFVDHKLKKVVMVWNPDYEMPKVTDNE